MVIFIVVINFMIMVSIIIIMANIIVFMVGTITIIVISNIKVMTQRWIALQKLISAVSFFLKEIHGKTCLSSGISLSYFSVAKV